MKQAPLNNASEGDRSHAAAPCEVVGGTVPEEHAFALSRWENEGGSPLFFPGLQFTTRPLVGTASQIEWAQLIQTRVNDEFNRVALSFRSIAERQSTRKRSDTEAIMAILEEKRVEVLSQNRAGYFIRDWQEISDQVRQMVGNDARYQKIKAERPARAWQTA